MYVPTGTVLSTLYSENNIENKRALEIEINAPHPASTFILANVHYYSPPIKFES